MQTRLVGRVRRGSALLLVAVSLAAVLGVGALAVDLGMLMKARTDAQRTADAAALAGATMYLSYASPVDARQPALSQALAYAARNYVGGTNVDTSGQGQPIISGTRWTVIRKEAVVVVIPDSSKVRVIIRRPGIGLSFARIFNLNTATVSAKAAAIALNSGGAKCVKPFALPDAWKDADNDLNGDRLWNSNEDWNFDPSKGDTYKPYEGTAAAYGGVDTTGYNSSFRNNQGSPTYVRDQGRQLVIKPQNPGGTFVIKPGIFQAWDMPNDPSQISCASGGGGGGASAYSNNICTCNNNTVETGKDYPIKNGNMVGPTKSGVEPLIALDPSAKWDQALNGGNGAVTNSDAKYGTDWRNSPRVIKVALWDPIEIQKSGKQNIKFNNFALMFLEQFDRSDATVTGRFISYAQGSGSPGPGGPLSKIVRLVE